MEKEYSLRGTVSAKTSLSGKTNGAASLSANIDEGDSLSGQTAGKESLSGKSNSKSELAGGMDYVEKGDPGDSAYDIAVNNGFEGTEAEWLASLKGKDGSTPFIIDGYWYIDGKNTYVKAQGDKGDPYTLNDNDKRSIAETVEREIEIWRYQPKEDDTLETESKEVVGAINELSKNITGNTWIMYDDLNKASPFDYAFNFTSNGESFVRMKGELDRLPDGEYYRVTYYKSDDTDKIVYDDGFGGWLDTAYQTIITDDINISFVGKATRKNTTVTERLDTKAKTVVGAINELLNNIAGNTWVLNNTFKSAKEFTLDFNFISNGAAFCRIEYFYYTDDAQDYYFIYYHRLDGTKKLVYNDGWKDSTYKTIYTDNIDISLDDIATKIPTALFERLTTDAKTVVGAINEVNEKIVENADSFEEQVKETTFGKWISNFVGNATDFITALIAKIKDVVKTEEVAELENEDEARSPNTVVGAIQKANRRATAIENGTTKVGASVEADYLSTARKITFTGDVSGEMTFDGSKDESVNLSVLGGGTGGKDGLSTYLYNGVFVTPLALKPIITAVDIADITIPSGRELQVGDFLIDTEGTLASVSGIAETLVYYKVEMSLKGEGGGSVDYVVANYKVEVNPPTTVVDMITTIQGMGADISVFNVVNLYGFQSGTLGMQINHYGGNVYNIQAIDLMSGQTVANTTDWSSVKIGEFLVMFSSGGSSSSGMISTTHSDLINLRDNGQLVVGQYYRITDYVCTTIQENTQATDSQFDIILQALDSGALSEVASATWHDGDTYFAGADVPAWEIKYCLDNDTTRFTWADEENGKGVIFYMKDEYNNECPYDFKNIQFIRRLDQEGNLDLENGEDTWCYTFGGMMCDRSIRHDDVHTFNNNSIGTYYTGCDEAFTIPDNVFLSTSECMTKNNKLGTNCNNNTFGVACQFNTFGDNCSDNTMGDYCYRNTFGNCCDLNTLGDECADNTFGNSCGINTLGYMCGNNTFGISCSINTFGDECYGNTVGNGRNLLTLGDGHMNYGIIFEMPQIRFTSAQGTNASEYKSFYCDVDTPLKLTVEIVGGGELQAGDQLQVCTRKRFQHSPSNNKNKYKLSRFAEYVVTADDLNKKYLTVEIYPCKEDNRKAFYALYHDGKYSNDKSSLSPLYLRIRRPKGILQNNDSGQTVDADFSNTVTIWKTYMRSGQTIQIL